MVRITEFGKGLHESQVAQGGVMLAELLGDRGIETRGRRIAINGNPAQGGAVVEKGDEVTVMPRVQGG